VRRGESVSVPAFPAGTVANATLPPDGRLSWVVEVLPYLDQENLARRIDRTAGWEAPANAAVRTRLDVTTCADWLRESQPGSADLTPYLGVAGLGADAAALPDGDRRAGVFGHDRRTALADIADGTSNTLVLLESTRDNGPWGHGGPATVRGIDPTDRPHLGTGRPFGGTHFAENTVFGRGKSIGCNAALADGSVRFLSNTIAPDVLEALATVAGGEPVGSDW
jgi:hypothetical protein